MKKRYVAVKNDGNYPNGINFLLSDDFQNTIQDGITKGKTQIKLQHYTVTADTSAQPHDVVTPYGSILDFKASDYTGSNYTQSGIFVPINEPSEQLANLSALTSATVTEDKLKYGVIVWSSHTGEHLILSGGFWGEYLSEGGVSPDAIANWVVSRILNTSFHGSGRKESKVFNLITCRPGDTKITGHTISFDRVAPFFCPVDIMYVSTRYGSFGNLRIGAEFDKTREEIYQSILDGYNEQDGIEEAMDALTKDTKAWLSKFEHEARERGRTHANFVIVNGLVYYGSALGSHGPAILSDSAFGPLLCCAHDAVSTYGNTGVTICNYVDDTRLFSVSRLLNFVNQPITSELIVQHARVPLNIQVQIEQLLGWSLRTGEVFDAYNGSREMVVDLARSSLVMNVLDTTGALNQESATALVNRTASSWTDAAVQGTDEAIINSVFALDIVNVSVQPQSSIDNYPAYILALQASLQNRTELLSALNVLLKADLSLQPIEINSGFGKWGT